MIDSKCRYHAAAHIVALTAGTGFEIAGHKTIRLSDQSGAFIVSAPCAMYPYVAPGDQVMVTISVIKGEVISTSSIERPN